MFSEKIKQLRKTVGFRLIIWYSGLFIFGALLFFSFSYLLLSSSLEKKDRESIEERLLELESIYRSEGIDFLERDVSQEKKFVRKISFFIRLTGGDDDKQLLVFPYQWAEFDIKELEKVRPTKKTIWINVSGSGPGGDLVVASKGLENDYLLQVGKSTGEREQILGYFRKIFALVMIPAVIFGFVGGIFLASRSLRPIRQLAEAVRGFAAGKMDSRVPSPNTGDELDELVTHFNNMVKKIEVLINGMKDSLDNVAHDLRTPMTRLRGTAEMALGQGSDENSLREALADCIEESERILSMLDTLMDISEAETGVMPLELQRVGVSAAVEYVLDLYGYVAEEKKIDTAGLCPEDLYVYADPLRLRQILSNLLDNGVKYTEPGGKIEIEAERVKGDVKIVVRDTGVGIEAEDLDKIWDRLYRCDESRTQKGLGLGLSLVKAVVTAHGGRVFVSSTPGKGSIFTVLLPSRD